MNLMKCYYLAANRNIHKLLLLLPIIHLLFIVIILSTNIVPVKTLRSSDKGEKFGQFSQNVLAIEGKRAALECPIIIPPQDVVYMVLWFRDDAGIPLYSFDLRNKTIAQATHWSDPEVFGTRAQFVFDADPAFLELKDIKRHDQGVYRCRVDFKASQTLSFRYNLTVIIMPEQPLILDRWGRQLNSSTIGPMDEGDFLILVCRVLGGRPQPSVRWFVDSVQYDDQIDQNTGSIAENRMIWPVIKRTDLHKIFTCQSVNTDLVPPMEKSFVLDLYLKPSTIEIWNNTVPLVAERKYIIHCATSGSRPNAVVSWLKGKERLQQTKESYNVNTTFSNLEFIPTIDDDGKIITCRAENPKRQTFFIEKSFNLTVYFKPIVNLQLGPTLLLEDIKEGDDVYFDCQIISKPTWKKLNWLHNGMPLSQNASARVIRSYHSLVLQKVSRHSAGSYQCSAQNSEGETVSKIVILKVKHSPLCAATKLAVVGVSMNEEISISCDVVTDPIVKAFNWKFENSQEMIELNSNQYTNNGTNSVLHYMPVSDQDYGTLSCWASNEIGIQKDPCMFQVILAGLPSPVKNCTWFNRTNQPLTIHCMPGYDGGLPQIFVLDIISLKDRVSRMNMTNFEEPLFLINSINRLFKKVQSLHESDVLKVFVYSINQKGRSSKVQVTEFFIGNSEKYNENIFPNLSPITIGIILTLGILFILIFIKCYLRHRQQLKLNVHTPEENFSKDSKCSLLGHEKTIDQAERQKQINARWNHMERVGKSTKTFTKPDFDLTDDERDPDLIPQYPRLVSSVQNEEMLPMTAYVTPHHLSYRKKEDDISTLFTMEKCTTELGSINLKDINDYLLATRVPESCV